MLRIRLTRKGGKNAPFYRLVAAESTSPRDGRFVENLGYYKPQSSPARLVLDLDRFDYWVKQGAQPSDTVQSLAGKARRGGDRKVAIGEPDIEAQKKLEQVEQQIYDSLDEFIWGVDEDIPASVLGATMTRTGLTIATMESMTGGLIGSAITDIPGCSAYYAGGFVTYQNQMKQALGVPGEAIQTYGVVSPEVALLMAGRTIDLTKADVGLAITGAAGPASADSTTPGTYYIGIKYKDNSTTIKGSFRSNRTNVKLRASTHAIIEVIKFLRSVETPID